jgi:acetylglutamate kinase
LCLLKLDRAPAACTDAAMSALFRRPPAFGLPPSGDDIADLAERALAAIPPKLAEHVRGVGIAVEDMPDDETLEELGMESAWELTGLYRGLPLTRRSVDDIAREPDLIFLYREPILLEWIESGEDLYLIVRSVLVHEIAHHFGFSDAAIEAIEREMD